MTATLANVAGVKGNNHCHPPQPGGINQTTLAACFIAKVDHVYQAGESFTGIAAMALWDWNDSKGW